LSNVSNCIYSLKDEWMLLAKFNFECVERNEILEYKNIFGDNVWIIEENLERFKQQIDMGIVDEWEGMIKYTKKFEFDYKDANMNYNFCIFR